MKIAIHKRNLCSKKIIPAFLKIIRISVLFLICSFIFSALSMVFKPRYHDLYGLIDKQGNELFSPQFDEIAKGFNLIAVRKNNLWGFVDRNGQMIVEPKYYHLQHRMGTSGTNIDDVDGLMAVADNKFNWGVIDSTGNERIKPQYKKLHIEYGGLIWIMKNNLWGLLNQHGRLVLPCVFEDYYDFNNCRAWVKKNNKWAQINFEGEYLSDFLFDDVKIFMNGDIAEVKIHGRKHLIRKDGRFISLPKYQSVCVYENGTVEVKINNKYGVIDDSGRFIIKPIYDRIYYMEYGYGIWLKDNEGLTDLNGKIILPPVYDRTFFCSKNILTGLKDNFWYLYDIHGNPITSEKYTDWEHSDIDNTVFAQSRNEWHLIYENGISILRNVSFNYSEGLASVEIDDKAGYIDMSGKIMIEPLYSRAEFFRNGSAIVGINDKCFLIDKKGKRISKKYNDLEYTYSGMFITVDWGEWSKKGYSLRNK